MTFEGCCRLGSWAVEEIAERLHVDIHKALDPLDDNDYLVIVARLVRSLIGATKGTEAKALSAAIRALDVDWATMSEGQRNKVFNAAKQAVAEIYSQAPAAAEPILSPAAETMVRTTRASTNSAYGLGIKPRVSAADKELTDLLIRSQMVYVKDEYGIRTAAIDLRAKQIVAEGLQYGLGRDDIAAALERGLKEYNLARSQNYWNLVANDFANKARTATQLNNFAEADVQKYRFVAVMDEVTSVICSLLNGKVWTVNAGLDLMKRSLELDDPEEIKNVRPWVRSSGSSLYIETNGRRTTVATVGEGGVVRSRLSDEELRDLGLIVPPLHGHCRSTIVAED